MKTNKSKQIYLYKQHSTRSDSRDLLTSRSRSRLRENLQSQDNKSTYHTANKQNTNKQQNLFTHSRTFTMTDHQQRIKRNYSPLYQRSTQQSQLFQKGVKKSQKNINFESKVDLTFKPYNNKQKNQNINFTPRTIRRRDPNKQQQNLLQLGNKPLLTSSRSITKKKDPNIQSSQTSQEYINREQLKLRKIKDPNIQSTKTADYVVKALSTHTGSNVKQVHLRFYKKENILSKQNQLSQINQKENNRQDIINEHRRHFSHLKIRAIKNNIQFKQNGISLKQNDQQFKQREKHQQKLFNHEFYKKYSRFPNKDNIRTNKQNRYNTSSYGTTKIVQQDYNQKINIKTEYKLGNQCKTKINFNRIAQLRKRFL